MWRLVYKRAGVPDSSVRTAEFDDGLLAVKRTRFLLEDGFEVLGLYVDARLVMDEQQIRGNYGAPAVPAR